MAGVIAFPLYEPKRRTYDIYLANFDGANRRRVVENASQPSLSPDGFRIAFRSWAPSDLRILVMDINGSNLMRVTNFHEDARPDWSPEGVLVFHSKRETDRQSRIYIIGTWIGAEESALRRDDQAVLGDSPAWLGKDRIVYNACAPDGCGLHIMNKDGSRPVFFLKESERVTPAGSPDGSQVAFMSRRDGNWEIYTITVEGGELKRLTNDPADDWLPTWSPDGRRIAFLSNRDGGWAIWAIGDDGSELTKLFDIWGTIDGRVQGMPDYSSVGWIEERISWAP